MNQARRKQLDKIAQKIQDIKEQLASIISEEEEALDNLPDSLRERPRGESMDACDNMDSAADCLDQAIEELEEITNGNI